jgi:hypothetical protein
VIQKNGSVAVLTLDTAAMRRLGNLTAPSKRAYCERHGYTFVRELDSLDHTRPPSWSKVLLLARELQRHELCLWIDADAAITDPSIPIHEVIQEVADSVSPSDLYIAHDKNGINCGVMCWRSSTRSYAAFQQMWDSVEHIWHCWWEQAALMHLLAGPHDLLVSYLPKTNLNSYPEDWQPGHFVLHTPGRFDREEQLRRRLPPTPCGRTIAFPGWYCTRNILHDGPCAAHPCPFSPGVHP